MKYFPISDSSLAAVGAISDAQKATKRGYLEARAIYQDPTKLKYALGNLTAAGVADDYMVSTAAACRLLSLGCVSHLGPQVVSMGDEIALAVPSGATGATMFKQWLSQMHYPSVGAFNDSVCYDAKKCNPAVHYYSNLYVDAYGLSVLSGATKTITTALKNAGVGANYSPLTYSAHGGYTQFAYWCKSHHDASSKMMMMPRLESSLMGALAASLTCKAS